jgi:nifR3 family TIM-barrel protein
MNHATFIQKLQQTRMLLPPLTGYTDYPYRVILASFQPGFLMAEMVHSSAVVRRNKRTMLMLRLVEGPHANGVQLLGRNPEEMASAAKMLVDYGFDFIDVNMGCTSKKVVRRGEGVALMRDEDRAARLVSSIVRAVDVPVTVKMRRGPSPSLLTYLAVSKRLQQEDVAAVTIHGRTGDHKFSPPVDLACVREAVAALHIPVVANGGISSGAIASQVLSETGCAGVMPGRYLIGNPWLVRELSCAVQDCSFVPPSFEERKAVCQRHFELLTDCYGPRGAAVRMRGIFSHYFPSIQGRAAFNRDVHLMGYTSFHRLVTSLEDVPWGSGEELG